MIKILLTGATGYIGANIAKRLVGDYEVHILVRKTSSLLQLSDFADKLFIHTLTSQYDNLAEIVNEVKPDIVIHLATVYILEHTEEQIEELCDCNILFGMKLLEAMKQSGVKCFINTGSQAQHYNGESYNPASLYAATKEAFSTILKYYTQTTGLKAISLHLCDTYGPNDKRHKLLNNLIKSANVGNCIGMSKGEQSIAYLYIDDVVEAFTVAIKRVQNLTQSSNETFTLLPNLYYSLKETVMLLEKTLGKSLNIKWGEKDYRERELFHVYEGNKLPGFNPLVELREGFKLMIK